MSERDDRPEVDDLAERARGLRRALAEAEADVEAGRVVSGEEVEELLRRWAVGKDGELHPAE